MTLVELPADGSEPQLPPALVQRLLGVPPAGASCSAAVLNGDAFVAAAEELPAEQLRAGIENCLLVSCFG